MFIFGIHQHQRITAAAVEGGDTKFGAFDAPVQKTSPCTAKVGEIQSPLKFRLEDNGLQPVEISTPLFITSHGHYCVLQSD